jgi:hypothetical protein
MPGEADLLRELEQLVQRARGFESRLEGIRAHAARREALESGSWPEPGSERYAEWKAAGEAVEAFYADFGALVEQAKVLIPKLAPLIGKAECEAAQRRLHPSAVGSTRQELEHVLTRVREFHAAESAGRGEKRAPRGKPGHVEARVEDLGAAEGARKASPARSVERPSGKRPDWAPRAWFEDEQGKAGRWVTAKEFAQIVGIKVQTLTNWRWQDRRAGREEAEPGKPRYRYFGSAVRYWLPAEMEGE